MCNHCIEVFCTNCGTEWCSRGCNYMSIGDDRGVDAKVALEKSKESKRVEDICPQCKSKEVYLGNIYT